MMSGKVIKYVLEHADNPHVGEYLTRLPALPDPTQSYFRKTHAEVDFPVFPRQYCVYYLAMSHYGEPAQLQQLGLFKREDEAILFAKRQYKLVMGTFPKVGIKNGATGKIEWKEMTNITIPDGMHSAVKVVEDCHNYLVIISYTQFMAHCLSNSSLWDPPID
jgi:hypothetical protein